MQADVSGDTVLCGRELHRHILERIERALGPRAWSWLAEEAGVPRSTLATQAAKPRFSVEVLLRVAQALNRDVTYFLPEVETNGAREGAAEEALDEIARIIDRASRS